MALKAGKIKPVWYETTIRNDILVRCNAAGMFDLKLCTIVNH